MIKPTTTTYDWALMIEQLLAAGATTREVGNGMGFEDLNPRMVSHYRAGVQPLYWRGKRLLEFWCLRLRKKEAEAPQTEVVRGHRAGRRDRQAFAEVKLPQWPPAAPASVKPVKRGRKKEPA